MKQSLILWIAALIITFIAGYTKNLTSIDYPVNGTMDLSSAEISFSLDKIYRGIGDYNVDIADAKGLKGELLWRNKPDTTSSGAILSTPFEANRWLTVELKTSGNSLTGAIPHHPPLSEVVYRIIINDKGNTVLIPQNSYIILRFLGFVPSELLMFYYITLFAGLLLALRTGLEIFKDPSRIKMFTIFTLISFFSFTWIFSPVKKACELGIIGGTKTASPAELFSTASIFLFVLWIIGLILVFNIKRPKIWLAGCSAITLVIFLFGKF